MSERQTETERSILFQEKSTDAVLPSFRASELPETAGCLPQYLLSLVLSVTRIRIHRARGHQRAQPLLQHTVAT